MTKSVKIKIFSFASFQALLFALLGLVAGVLYAFGGLAHDIVTTGAVNWGTLMAFMAIVGMPVIFGVLGFIAGIIEALLFNAVAKWIGGMALDFGEKE